MSQTNTLLPQAITFTVSKSQMRMLVDRAEGRIVGKLLTWAESAYADKTQLNAVKSVIKQIVYPELEAEFWGQIEEAMIRTVKSDDLRMKIKYEDGSEEINHRITLPVWDEATIPV